MKGKEIGNVKIKVNEGGKRAHAVQDCSNRNSELAASLVRPLQGADQMQVMSFGSLNRDNQRAAKRH